jgi:hypothetical protein
VEVVDDHRVKLPQFGQCTHADEYGRERRTPM